MRGCPPTPSPPLASSKACSVPPLIHRTSGRLSRKTTVPIAPHYLLPLLSEARACVFHSSPGYTKRVPVSRSRVCILSKPLLPALLASLCESMNLGSSPHLPDMATDVQACFGTLDTHHAYTTGHAVGHLGPCAHLWLLYLGFLAPGHGFTMTGFKAQGYKYGHQIVGRGQGETDTKIPPLAFSSHLIL